MNKTIKLIFKFEGKMLNFNLSAKILKGIQPPLDSTPVGVKKLDAERENTERIQPPLYSTPVGVETSDPKIPATDSSARKRKALK